MKIVFIDDDIIVCAKAAGELSEGEGQNALPSLIRSELMARGEKNTDVFPVHRLDRETVGMIVFTRSSASAAALSGAIQRGEFKKQYLAVLNGSPSADTDTLVDLLFYDRRRGKSFVTDRERGGVKKAVLDYTVLCRTQSLSLVRVELKTGRTHQIRVQFASRSLPLVGDQRYGAPKDGASGIALVSHVLRFPHPKAKKVLEFTADIPEVYPWTYFSFLKEK